MDIKLPGWADLYLEHVVQAAAAASSPPTQDQVLADALAHYLDSHHQDVLLIAARRWGVPAYRVEVLDPKVGTYMWLFQRVFPTPETAEAMARECGLDNFRIRGVSTD